MRRSEKEGRRSTMSCCYGRRFRRGNAGQPRPRALEVRRCFWRPRAEVTTWCECRETSTKCVVQVGLGYVVWAWGGTSGEIEIVALMVRKPLLKGCCSARARCTNSSNDILVWAIGRCMNSGNSGKRKRSECLRHSFASLQKIQSL